MASHESALDFEALLSREYRPAGVTRLSVREQYDPTKPPEPTLTPRVGPPRDKETSRFILDLVAHTPAFTQHFPDGETTERLYRDGQRLLTSSLSSSRRKKSGRNADIEPKYHPVELEDWESKIDWGGNNSRGIQKVDPMDLVQKPRNHLLDTLDFDDIDLEADPCVLAEKARHAPLILELGVAGQSIAKHVYQKTILSRPEPAIKSEAYRKRVDKEFSSQPITSTAEVSKAFQTDRDRQEAIREERQRKRERMEKEKTTRVLKAMGTLSSVLGGGRGRTIKSSLMGPGGTERTGRPSKSNVNSSAHDAEYIEQLDMITSHALYKDLAKVSLRQYHRPKLPLSVVRPELPWQLQVRHIPPAKKTEAAGAAGGSYQALMMGTSHAGSISKVKLRTETDLSPTEGKLVLLEYSEERPPVQLTKGMACKIVNFYRGEKAFCPISAGGGDRPARRKRQGDGEGSSQSKIVRLPRLEGPNRATSIADWVGKVHKRKKDGNDDEGFDVIPEGVTEILHPKVHGPFIGEVEEGAVQTGILSNMFVAPMFRHEPEETDFLMILTPPSGAMRAGEREVMGVVLRDLPSSVFTVGQTEPRTRVNGPGTQGEKSFMGPFISYLIAKTLTRAIAREGYGLRIDEIADRAAPNLELPTTALRQRLKQVAIFDKETGIWTSKKIGEDEYPGVDSLAKSIAPEGIAAFETESAFARRLSDIGIHRLYEGANAITSVSIAMMYLTGQLNFAREAHKKIKKFAELSRSSKGTLSPAQLAFYSKAVAELEDDFKMLKKTHEVAQFLYEELQLAPWILTGDFIDVHKKGEGTGMLRLTGLGDPSGLNEGFSFLREADPKSKVAGNAALSAQVKKITGTEDDLRKLTMKQMASLLRSYGMPQKQIDTLKRWDRVHVIRDLSTKAASDGIGDGLERFARGEKKRLSEQKQEYRARIQEIWRRQVATLSAVDQAEKTAEAAAGGADTDDAAVSDKTNKKKEVSDSDDDDEDDDFAAAFEEELLDRNEANQIMASHAKRSSSDKEVGGLGQLHLVTRDAATTKEAQALAALKRQLEEERVAQQNLDRANPGDYTVGGSSDRKAIRKRITEIHPDGKVVVKFKFVVQQAEVDLNIGRVLQQDEKQRDRIMKKIYEQPSEDKPPGHAMFEDEDDFEYSSSKGSKKKGGARRAGGRGRGGGRKARVIEDRGRKRRRGDDEDDEAAFVAHNRRKGTSNRRERGSIRERRPHVLFSEKLESIRASVEMRPNATYFLKPVNRKLVPRYYELISNPIDLSTMKVKIDKYEYRNADALLKDFELMKNNAIKFNGPQNPISVEAITIYNQVREKIEHNHADLDELAEAVKDQFDTKPKRKKVKSTASTKTTASVGGHAVDLGDLGSSTGLKLDMNDSDSGSDDNFVINIS